MRALRESERRVRALVEASPDGILLHRFDAHGKSWPLLEVNDVCCRALGYSREELLRLRPSDLLAGDMVEPALQACRGLREETPVLFQAEAVTREGQRLPVEIRSRLIELDGAPAVLSIARDLDDRRRTEESLRQAEARLREAQRLEAVARLAGGIAHEFNGMLTIILLNCQLLAEEAELPALAREDLEEIRRAAQKVAGLTRQLVAFGRQRLLAPRRLDINRVLDDSAALMRGALGERIRLETRLGDGAMHVLADPDELRQLLAELAANARDAMPEGGIFRIETSPASLDDPGATSFDVPQGDYVMLRMKDEGEIAPDLLGHLFEPFLSTAKLGRTSGLGLSMVYGIVRQTGGGIRVLSVAGGTVFEICLPRLAAEQPDPGHR